MFRIAWFEIPVIDLERAVRFYSALLNREVPILDKRGNYGSMVGLLTKNDEMVGTLTRNTEYVPSSREGCLIYLNLDDEPLEPVLSRVEAAGGRILLPITPIDPRKPVGRVAWIMDSEGNRIGLHCSGYPENDHAE
ncbi:MAG: VOC family protein [Gammaproteobacteria bacterium]